MMALKCPHITVTCLDINQARVDAWNSDNLPIHEPGLLEIVREVRGTRLFFAGVAEYDQVVSEADMIFVCVNTPTKKHGVGKGQAADLTSWERAARGIAPALRSDGPKLRVVVEKSTVPVHTADAVAAVLKAEGVSNVEVLSNPEFLAEGTAIRDLTEPDRVLIGGSGTTRGHQAIEMLASVYEQWVPKERVCRTNVWSAELSKLIANAMLAQRVSSINCVAEICEATGADVGEVARIVGMDSRIGSKFLAPSIGFGGSCFQKDILNLIYICHSKGLVEVAEYWSHVIKINDLQRTRFAQKVIASLFNTVDGKKIAMFGFAFKKDTGDTRETSSMYIAKELLDERCLLCVHDPQVEDGLIRSEIAECCSTLDEMPPLDDLLSSTQDPYEAAKDAHAILICTEWDMYAELDYERIYESMKRPAHVFDGRRVLNATKLREIGFKTYVIGSPDLEQLGLLP
eukprot:TRINITY_DN20184_c0_g1_i2.p1 TRINITY_DN20184_c0_g1~~TRINITY_DN20184_c0_g1_i2.p1  ORF type:complete len:458 (-),score=110.21 TRINITY_DN20184_c0_g1_i2:45-1418(-)